MISGIYEVQRELRQLDDFRSRSLFSERAIWHLGGVISGVGEAWGTKGMYNLIPAPRRVIEVVNCLGPE
jgi:hypothetical protein